MTLAHAIALVCLLCVAAQAQEPLFDNLDFSGGAEGWTAWTGTQAHPWEVEPAGGPDGEPALRIDAVNWADGVMVMTATERIEAGHRYLIEAWWKLDDLSPRAQVDLRAIYRDEEGKWLDGVDLYPATSEREGDWTRSRYRISVPAHTAGTTLGVWVRNATGTIRVARLSIAPLEDVQRTFDSMYVYDPHQVELGPTPLRAFYALQEAGSPFLPRSDRWNRLMVRIAFAQEDLSRARRAMLYAGAPPEGMRAHEDAIDRLLEALDALQQTYGRLYDAGDAEGLEGQFDAAAGALEADTAQAEADLRALLERLGAAAGEAAWVTLPPTARDADWWDTGTGTPRFLLWSRWSDQAFWEREEPLNLGPGSTLTAGAPRTFTEGVADWTNYLDQWRSKGNGKATESSLITHYALHDKGYLAPEFVQQQGDDPDLRMWDAEGEPMGPSSGVVQLNWLNPQAREHMVDVLTQMAEFFRDRPEFKFYVTAWESAGPYVGGVRIGNNPSHVADFRRYLARQYEGIEALNQWWGTNYASFEDISPAPEEAAPPDDPRSPLYMESQRWAQEAFADYIALITETISRVDNTKPVVGQFNAMMDNVFNPRIWDSVDILGHHNRNPRTMAMMIWLASTARYTGKTTSLFENFWGCQEDHPRRLGEERAMRAQMRRYLQRHVVWGRSIQVWWYAYTSAPYLLTYNGNWFNPVYDLTTFRYSAAGLPVEKSKADRFEQWLLGSEIAPSRMVLIQPYDSMLAQGRNSTTWREWLQWHEFLHPRDLAYEAVPSTYFEDMRASLNDFDLVILPFAPHLGTMMTHHLLEFMRRGGTVVSSGAPGLHDELGRPNGSLLRACEPPLALTEQAEPGRDWRHEFEGVAGEAGVVEARVGEGRLVMLTQPLARLPGAHEALAALIRERVAPPAEAPGTTLELVLRRLPDGTGLLSALNADPDYPTAGEVSVEGEFSRVADVDMPRPVAVPSRVEAGRTKFTVSLDPGGTAYFVLGR